MSDVSTAARTKRFSKRGLWWIAMSLLLGLSSATQCLAYFFHFDEALGPHLGPIYPPWAALVWAQTLKSSSPNSFQVAYGVGLLVTAVLFGLAAQVLALHQIARNKYSHGSARWATRKEIRKAGLLAAAKDSVYVGAIRTARGLRYLLHSGPEHIMTIAPTRSGKSLGPVLMTLLSWAHSVFVLDLKGELAATTAGWRKRFAKNKVLMYEPASPSSIAWNPLTEIDVTSVRAVGHAQNLATLLVDPDGKGLPDHWTKTAQALLTGMILYVLHKARAGGGVASIAGIDDMLVGFNDDKTNNPVREMADVWNEMLAMRDICPVVAAAAKDMRDRPDEEGGSVLSTAKSVLSLYRDPVIARNTSRSDFSVRDLMHHDSPVTLYLITQPADKDRLRPLVRLLCNSVVRNLADGLDYVPPKWLPRSALWPSLVGIAAGFVGVAAAHMFIAGAVGAALALASAVVAFAWLAWQLAQPGLQTGRMKGRYKHRLLLMLDEFPTLRRLPIIQEAMAYLAGFGIKAYILIQDRKQLTSSEEGYGPHETISAHCHIKTAYPTNCPETAKYLSELIGVTTVVREQVTLSGSGLTARSRVHQEVQRPLKTADEIMRMEGPTKQGGPDGLIVAPGEMVLIAAGYPAVQGVQPLSVLDPVFRARLAVPTVESDRIEAA